jgi:hypothetical protein
VELERAQISGTNVAPSSRVPKCQSVYWTVPGVGLPRAPRGDSLAFLTPLKMSENGRRQIRCRPEWNAQIYSRKTGNLLRIQGSPRNRSP